ncbi:hypothetical protein C8J56DRAFT_259798 [Mycena floridula]|nr:hypothetical protein C8J56DRAFT_259798 [Mycena floridula]
MAMAAPAYRDPYSDNRASALQEYDNASEFNPYTASHQAHPTYDQHGSGFDTDNVGAGGHSHSAGQTPQRQSTAKGDFNAAKRPHFKEEDERDPEERSGFDHDEEIPSGPRSHKGFGEFTSDRSVNPWTKGSRVSCIGRFFCCTLLIFLFLFVSILLTLALWARPPAITFGSVSTSTTTSPFQLTSDGVAINLGLNISVSNPNAFAVSFSKVNADIFYPINNTKIGNGVKENVVFAAHSAQNITFPFTITYSAAADPSGAIFNDLVAKCGAGQLTVNLEITVGLRIVVATISPKVNNSFTFACPLDKSTLENLGKLLGKNTGTRRDLDSSLLLE